MSQDHNNIYSILGKFNSVLPTPADTIKQQAQEIRESVEARGSVLEGVAKVQAELQEKFEQGMAEATNDYFKRRRDEEDRIAGTKPPAKRVPKQTDYEKRRKQQSVDEGTTDWYKCNLAPAPMRRAVDNAVRLAVRQTGDQSIANMTSALRSNFPASYVEKKIHSTSSLEALEAALQDEGIDFNDLLNFLDKQAQYAGNVEEGRETLDTKVGKIYKGGTYGNSYTGDDEAPKHVPKKGQRGRPAKEKPMTGNGLPSDPFGRTKGKVPAGKKGKVIKGKGHDDTTRDYHADQAFDRDEKNLKEKAPPGDKYERMVKHAKKSYPKGSGAPYAIAWKEYNKEHSKTESINESVNFRTMEEESHSNIDEMLECLSNAIKNYKDTGAMSDDLRDHAHLHRHIVGQKMKEAMNPLGRQDAMQLNPDFKQKPTSALGKIGHGLARALGGPSDDELLRDLQKRSIEPTTTIGEDPMADTNDAVSLNELAKLAGLDVDEQNMGAGTGGMEEELSEADAPVAEPKTQPVNAPKKKYFSMRASTMGPGEGDPGEKRMYPKANGGDNAMSKPARGTPIDGHMQESAPQLEARLAAEYESIKKVR